MQSNKYVISLLLAKASAAPITNGQRNFAMTITTQESNGVSLPVGVAEWTFTDGIVTGKNCVRDNLTCIPLIDFTDDECTTIMSGTYSKDGEPLANPRPDPADGAKRSEQDEIWLGDTSNSNIYWNAPVTYLVEGQGEITAFTMYNGSLNTEIGTITGVYNYGASYDVDGTISYTQAEDCPKPPDPIQNGEKNFAIRWDDRATGSGDYGVGIASWTFTNGVVTGKNCVRGNLTCVPREGFTDDECTAIKSGTYSPNYEPLANPAPAAGSAKGAKRRILEELWARSHSQESNIYWNAPFTSGDPAVTQDQLYAGVFSAETGNITGFYNNGDSSSLTGDYTYTQAEDCLAPITNGERIFAIRWDDRASGSGDYGVGIASWTFTNGVVTGKNCVRGNLTCVPKGGFTDDECTAIKSGTYSPNGQPLANPAPAAGNAKRRILEELWSGDTSKSNIYWNAPFTSGDPAVTQDQLYHGVFNAEAGNITGFYNNGDSSSLTGDYTYTQAEECPEPITNGERNFAMRWDETQSGEFGVGYASWTFTNGVVTGQNCVRDDLVCPPKGGFTDDECTTIKSGTYNPYAQPLANPAPAGGNAKRRILEELWSGDTSKSNIYWNAPFTSGDPAVTSDRLFNGKLDSVAGSITGVYNNGDSSEVIGTIKYTQADCPDPEAGGDAGGEAGGDAGGEAGGDAGGEAGGDAGGEAGGDAGGEVIALVEGEAGTNGAPCREGEMGEDNNYQHCDANAAGYQYCCGTGSQALGDDVTNFCGDGMESIEDNYGFTRGGIDYSHKCGAMKIMASAGSFLAAAFMI